MNGLVRKVPDVIIRHICVLTPQAQSSEFNIIRKLKMSPEGTIVPGELTLSPFRITDSENGQE